MDPDLIGFTRSRMSSKGVLTYAFAPGAILPPTKAKIRRIFSEVDARLGLDFKETKNRRRADVLINNGERPPGAVVATVWTDVRWEIRFPPRYYGDYLMRHELGHVLGFGHKPMGTRTLMAPSWNGYTNFTTQDWRDLERVWGRGV